MNSLTCVLSTLIFISPLTACSQDAVVGEPNPIICGAGAGGSIDGTLFLPNQQATNSLGAVSDVTFTTGTFDHVAVTVPEGVFHINFSCGQSAATETYTMLSPSDNEIQQLCPNAVTAYLEFGNDSVSAVDGTLIIDELVGLPGSCFSGRFAGIFGVRSESLSGWFRTP